MILFLIWWWWWWWWEWILMMRMNLDAGAAREEGHETQSRIADPECCWKKGSKDEVWWDYAVQKATMQLIRSSLPEIRRKKWYHCHSRCHANPCYNTNRRPQRPQPKLFGYSWDFDRKTTAASLKEGRRFRFLSNLEFVLASRDPVYLGSCGSWSWLTNLSSGGSNHTAKAMKTGSVLPICNPNGYHTPKRCRRRRHQHTLSYSVWTPSTNNKQQ